MDEKKRQRLLRATVEYLDAVRTAYLQTRGASPLKHWDMLLERVRLACRTSETVGEWVTALARGLRLEAPSSFLSSAQEVLCQAVGETGGPRGWLEWLESEYALVLAEVRLRVEARREVSTVVKSLKEANE